jgi:hypothetical protein
VPRLSPSQNPRNICPRAPTVDLPSSSRHRERARISADRTLLNNTNIMERTLSVPRLPSPWTRCTRWRIHSGHHHWTVWDNLNRDFVPRQSRDPRECCGLQSDSADKMISFCPVESSCGQSGQDRSRREQKSCRDSAENAGGQNEKTPERQKRFFQSAPPPPSQKDKLRRTAENGEPIKEAHEVPRLLPAPGFTQFAASRPA